MTEPTYPVEVFVNVNAQLQKQDVPVYVLIRRDDEAICPDWKCSHFATVGRSMLRYDPNLNDQGKAVTLCCETDPVQFVGVDHFERLTFCEQMDKSKQVKMTHRVEVSGYQIKRKATNPIKVFRLDDPLGDLSFDWAREVEFMGKVYGQREDDRVWLETAGEVKWR